jgi:hypothetical protein
MLLPTAPASWTVPASTSAAVRAAFASLAHADQRVLSALLFDGAGDDDLRDRAGAAMLAVHRSLSPHATSTDGALAGLLALHALAALAPDDAALIDALLDQQPGLQRHYQEYCDLAGELCRIVLHVAPSPDVLARLMAIDDRAMN